MQKQANEMKYEKAKTKRKEQKNANIIEIYGALGKFNGCNLIPFGVFLQHSFEFVRRLYSKKLM